MKVHNKCSECQCEIDTRYDVMVKQTDERIDAMLKAANAETDRLAREASVLFLSIAAVTLALPLLPTAFVLVSFVMDYCTK